MKPQEIVIRVVVEQPSAVSAATDDGFTEVQVEGKKYTKSQLMRFALLRKYNKLSDHKHLPFEAWYEEQMDRIIAVIDKG